MRIRFLLAGVLLLCGCENESGSESCWREAVTEPESGDIIPCWVERREGETWPADDKPVVTNDYGILLVWRNGNQRFYLFDNIEKRYFGTKKPAEFLEALESLPKGVGIEWWDTCTVSLAHEMPRQEWNAFRAALAKGNHSLIGRTDGKNIFCTCLATGLGVPWIEGDEQDEGTVGEREVYWLWRHLDDG